MKETPRNPNIDLLKGLLILLVIVGHIVLGGLNDSFLRYFIYSFHMPIFIGLAGFLITEEKLKRITLSKLIAKYWTRVILPWLIAVNIYFIINNFSSITNTQTILVEDYINAYLYPYYHLWFIIGFLTYIFITWLLLKVGFKLHQILIVALLLSLASKYRLFDSHFNLISSIVDYIHYSIRLYFYIFFILGIFLKSKSKFVNKLFENKSIFWGGVLICIISGLMFLQNFYFNIPMDRILYYIFNSLFLTLIIVSISKKKLFRSKILEFVGKNSLMFYLYHVVGKTLVIKLLGTDNLFWYYIANSLMALILGIIIYYFKSRRDLNYS
jgi:fucose 4-O-acetylase-like acetyltransferase